MTWAKLHRHEHCTHAVVPGERIAVVDVLRAYALFGIIITHSVTGFLAGQEPVTDFMLFTPLDRAVAQLEHLFTFGKFYSIFSFLFGLSFAIQLRNAMQKGAGFSGRFAWRLLVLALIALAHGAFFAGDILIVYALLGLLLIPFRNMKTKTLLIVGLILSLNIPGLLLGAAYLRCRHRRQNSCRRKRKCRHNSAIRAAAACNQAIRHDRELLQANYNDWCDGQDGLHGHHGRLWITFACSCWECRGPARDFKDSEAPRFLPQVLWPSDWLRSSPQSSNVRYPMGEQLRSSADLLHWFSWTVQQISLSTFSSPGSRCCTGASVAGLAARPRAARPHGLTPISDRPSSVSWCLRARVRCWGRSSRQRR